MLPVPIHHPFGPFLPSDVGVPGVELHWCWLGIVAVPWYLWALPEVVPAGAPLQQ